MAEHNELGKKGEEMAREFLIRKGFKVLATNWRYLKDEIDIIAMHNSQLVIVEVKTRRTNAFGEPEEAVTKNKQKFLVRAANAFVEQKALENEVRFDIISVIVCGKKWQITHIEDAFYPTL
jgi:putative endonuclease